MLNFMKNVSKFKNNFLILHKLIKLLPKTKMRKMLLSNFIKRESKRLP